MVRGMYSKAPDGLSLAGTPLCDPADHDDEFPLMPPPDCWTNWTAESRNGAFRNSFVQSPTPRGKLWETKSCRMAIAQAAVVYNFETIQSDGISRFPGQATRLLIAVAISGRPSDNRWQAQRYSVQGQRTGLHRLSKRQTKILHQQHRQSSRRSSLPRLCRPSSQT